MIRLAVFVFAMAACGVVQSAPMPLCNGTLQSQLDSATGYYNVRCSMGWSNVSDTQLMRVATAHALFATITNLTATQDQVNSQATTITQLQNDVAALQIVLAEQEVQVETGFTDLTTLLTYISIAAMYGVGFVSGSIR